MSIFFGWAGDIVRDFSIWDIAVFKIYLFSVGVIFGAYFSNFFKKWIWWVVAIAVISGAWMIYKTVS